MLLQEHKHRSHPTKLVGVIAVRSTRKRDPMSMKVTIHQLQEHLPDLLERTIQSGEECIVR